MMEYREGGLKDQGGSVDPVSGNEVPPGALKEEVRDDIDARLSEGEFVFPADVVRYIGLEKLMTMRQQAKAGLARMEDMGQMSNADEATMEDTVPASVFDMPDDMDVPAVMIAELEMAEGGDVQGEKRYKSFRELMGTDGDTAEIVTYVNKDGRKIIIMHINGAPVSQVPDGFYPEGTDAPADDEATDDGDDATAPVEPAFDPNYRGGHRPDDPSDPPEKPQGAIVVTGGYIENNSVRNGTKWDLMKMFNGDIKLSNSEHGEVTLTKEEAAAAGIGQGPGSFFGAIMPDAVAAAKERTAVLNSGNRDDPSIGNEIHKALIEKAQLQKAGKQLIQSNQGTMGFTDSLASAFGRGPVSDAEAAIAKALGNTDGKLTDSDYAIIGQALTGVPNNYNLPGAADNQQKINDIRDIVSSFAEVPGMTRPTPKPTKEERGLKTPTISTMTTDGSGDNNSGFTPSPLGLSGNRYVISDNEDQNPPGDPLALTPPSYAPLSGMALTQGFRGSDYDPRLSESPGGVDYGTVSQFEPTRPTPKPTRPNNPDPSNDPRPGNQYSISSNVSDDNPYSMGSAPTTYGDEDRGGFGGSMMVMHKGGYAKKGKKKKKRKGLASR